jgi:hypothetical protein
MSGTTFPSVTKEMVLINKLQLTAESYSMQETRAEIRVVNFTFLHKPGTKFLRNPLQLRI